VDENSFLFISFAKVLRASILFILLSCSSILFGQTMKGKHFWFGFLENSFPSSDLQMMVVSDSTANITIKAPAQGYSINLKVPKGDTVINLALSVFYPTAGSENVDDKGGEVLSDKYIQLFILNKDIFSTDASHILPFSTIVSGDKYIVQTLPGSFGGGASFVVVSTKDNTSLKITPTAKTISGSSANNPFNITLDKGESFMVVAADNGDLSGSTVIANNDCDEFVVFSGSKSAQSDYSAFCTGGDHLFSQCSPISHFGNEFVVMPFNNQPGNYLVKITAAENNTDIFVNGVIAANINKGMSFDYQPPTPYAKVCLSTSKPTSVFQYMKSQTCNSDSGELGDPSMIYIPQVNRWTKHTRFGIFNVPNINLHFVNIVLHKKAIPLLKIKTTALFSVAIDSSNMCNDYALVTLACAVGNYTLDCDSPFYSYVYSKGKKESVAYLTGAEFFPFSTSFNLFPKTLCFNQQPVTFSLDSDSFTVNQWNMGDGTLFTNTNSVSHSYNKDGIYNVQLLYGYKGNSCPKDTLSIPVTIFPKVSFNGLQDKILCEGEKVVFSLFGEPSYKYLWSDNVFASKREVTKIGTYSVVAIDNNECRDTQFVTLSDSGCYDKRLKVYNFFSPNGDNHNDSWNIDNQGYSAINYKVFNRYGTAIKQGDYLKNEIWDGKFEDSKTLCTEGTYYYYIEAVVKRTNTIETYYGIITLLR